MQRALSPPAAPWSPVALVVSLLGSFGTAAVGSWLTFPGVTTWYRTIEKPPWTPPDAVFGPVWTVLYALMAIAAWIMWRHRARDRAAARIGLILFVVQLALNAAWSGLFFAARAIGLALVEIALLWLAIAATITAFRRVSGLAAGLLVPYLAWVSFALALNAAIFRLN